MAYFAHITNGKVDSVIIIEPSVIEGAGGWHCPTCGVHKPLSEWKETSSKTYEGATKDGSEPLRKNFAAIGYDYDTSLDAFIPPKTYDSFVLDEAKGVYVPPKEEPKDGKAYMWDEKTLDYVEWKPDVIKVQK